MNLLAIISYPFLPATTGGEICTLGLHNELAKKHQVTVFTVKPYSDVFNQPNFDLVAQMPFKASRYINPLHYFTILSIIRKKHIELVFFEQPWFGWLLFLLRFTTRSTIYIRAHNVEYLRFKSIGKIWWPLLFLYEKITYQSAHNVCFLTEDDRKQAIKSFNLKPEKTQVVSYGINIKHKPQKNLNAKSEIKQQYQINSTERIVLFYGTMGYKPNDDAVSFIADQLVDELLKHSGFSFKILICGKNLPNHLQEKIKLNPHMHYCGFVDDLNKYIQAADVVLNPIKSGGGIKTKAIDALAQNATVVSTNTGAIGIEKGVCGKNLVVVDDHDLAGFAEQVILACNTPEHSIPDTFYALYNWEEIQSRMNLKGRLNS